MFSNIWSFEQFDAFSCISWTGAICHFQRNCENAAFQIGATESGNNNNK